MRKVILVITTSILATMTLSAQKRVDNTPEQLTYKSKEIKSALFWNQNSSTGKWESRKNTKLIYLGEGVAIDNFNSIFIGDYQGKRYLFLDFKEYSWHYPALKTEWIYKRMMMAALISEKDYIQMDSLKSNQVLTIMPRFYNKMFKGHNEYSFPFFLSLLETLRSSTETMYKSYERTNGKDYAEWYLKKEYPPLEFIVLKRVTESNGEDVVRFTVYPHAMKELINTHYFEIEYSTYRNLFTQDKKNIYK